MKEAPARCMAIGNFDGLHLGHQALIATAIGIAKKKSLESMVLTFCPHPVLYFHPQKHFLLTAPRYHDQSLAGTGVDEVICLDFERTHGLTADAFIRQELLPRHVRHVVVGENFTMGKNRSCSAHQLVEKLGDLGIETSVVPHIQYANERVSSTRIRAALHEGDIGLANALLGRAYSIFGEVRVGRRLGAQLGFPTANIENNDQVFPKKGVYLTAVTVDPHAEGQRRYDAVTAVTETPTIATATALRIESHLLNVGENFNIYGREIRVDFRAFLRDERRFNSRRELVEQIENDIQKALQRCKDFA